MAIRVDRDRRAPAPTNVDDAATEADALCKCVLLLAMVTGMSACLSLSAELRKDGVRGVVRTVRGMVFVCGNAAALIASGFVLLRRGIRYSHLQFIIILDVLGLIGAYSAASVKTSFSVVSLVAAVLLYIAIQVLLFLSKPVGRLLLSRPHVRETPLRDVCVKCLILSLTLATSMAYEVRISPTPLATSGDPDTGIVLPEVTELVYFHWNDTASVASLVFIHLYLLSMSFSKPRILYRALQVAMTLDLFAFVVASACRNSLQLTTFVYISVLAPVFLYAGIMAMVSMSEMFPTCATWRRVLMEKMEQYCVPNWLTKSFELPTNGHTEDTRQTTEWNLEDNRQFLLFLAIGMANAIKNQASMSLLQSRSRPVLVVDSWAFHFNELYVGNLRDQAGMSSLSSLWQENTSGYVIGNLNLAFYCYAIAFTGSLAIIVLLANRKICSRGLHYYAMWLFIVLELLCLVGTIADGNLPKKSMVDVFRDASILLVTMIILSRGPRNMKTIQSILRWLQHTLQEDPSEEEGSEDELEFGLAGGGTDGEPIVEISAPVLGGQLTLVLAIPVMRMVASPVKILMAFIVASFGAELWPKLLARLLQALARVLHRRCIPSARRGWYMVLATCNGLCKVIHALCSKACVCILVIVIWFPSLMPNLKLKFKIPKISVLVGVLIALATPATTTTTVDSPATETTATGMHTSTTAMTTSGTSSSRRKHPPRIEPRPRRNCRPNTRLIGEEWVN